MDAFLTPLFFPKARHEEPGLPDDEFKVKLGTSMLTARYEVQKKEILNELIIGQTAISKNLL